jgi:type II restriction/modification system DNA methylase subunit YeeA
MDTAKIKKYAQFARRSLIDQVGGKLKQVLASDSPTRRESPKAIADLEKQIAASDKKQVIENVAYTWFNRFCALRFMDVNQYNRIAVLSPLEGQFQPEILAEAKAGYIDEALMNAGQRKQVFNLLNGSAPSRDPQTEAYRKLIVAVCNDYHRIMPYLFQRIDDFTEVLMPDDLLSENSILASTREAMTLTDCESVEVIGWLYQFYISEKKDEVFADLKKNKKITPENIPAATQLFTPHWIVRYLVENSLGRLWMLNNPDSKVIEKMDYYIQPADENKDEDYLKISSPEELKICDPTCGSGHMVTYAYDLLYAIYLDAGYDSVEIPEKILTHNLYGIEIDERAAELAAFALSMKALKGNPFDDSNNRRRFFRKPLRPNICRLENIHFSEEELDEYMEFIGSNLFTADLRTTLKQFDEADNFGSLIRPELTDVEEILATLGARDVSGQLFLSNTHQRVLKVLRQSGYLSPKYHVVIANPPYMGNKGMNSILSNWLKVNYSDSKSDLMTAFMERCISLNKTKGVWGMINIPSWMFLSSYEKLRVKLLRNNTFNTLLHLGRGIFGSDFGTVAFTVTNHSPRDNSVGIYRRLFEKHVQVRTKKKIEQLFMDVEYNKYILKQCMLGNIPGSPIGYWASPKILELFQGKSIGNFASVRQGMATTDNDRFLRCWWELSLSKIAFGSSSTKEANTNGYSWFPYNKGGEYRKWYGNFQYIINYENDGQVLIDLVKRKYPNISDPEFVIKNRSYYCRDGVTWSDVTSGKTSFRYLPKGFIFDGRGSSIFSEELNYYSLITCLNTPITMAFADLLNPSAVLNPGDIKKIPAFNRVLQGREKEGSRLVELGKLDWDMREESWGFSRHLMVGETNISSIHEKYINIRDYFNLIINEMLELELGINRQLLSDYGLGRELTENISLDEITISCNPHYRYGGNKTEAELEALLLADTMREFISYSVGCMFGRYSLDKEGLILSNQGETLADYLQQIPEPQFKPDEDNVIPLINFEGDWFEDDISERFKVFLKTTFGEQHYDENLNFIEQAIGKNINKFFISEFYTDHIKRYKKRPIYWLFSSPKGSFNALIYLHRYRPDTASIVLNDYLREFRTKLSGRKDNLDQITISATASQKQKTNALKTIDKINKVLEEINEYEHDILYPLATRQIEIDLDDGVKHNYPLFGKALKSIAGLSSK